MCENLLPSGNNEPEKLETSLLFYQRSPAAFCHFRTSSQNVCTKRDAEKHLNPSERQISALIPPMIRCLQPFFFCLVCCSQKEGRGKETSLCFRELVLIVLNLSFALQSEIPIHFLTDSKNIHRGVFTAV